MRVTIYSHGNPGCGVGKRIDTQINAQTREPRWIPTQIRPTGFLQRRKSNSMEER